MLLSARNKRPNSDDGLIPLINIVFLLLIFFMIAGQMRPPEQQEITPPVSTSQQKVDIPQWLVEMNDQRQLRINGELVALEDIGVYFAGAGYGVDSDQQQPDIALKLDQSLLAEDLDSVLNPLREQGVHAITLYSRSPES